MAKYRQSVAYPPPTGALMEKLEGGRKKNDLGMAECMPCAYCRQLMSILSDRSETPPTGRLAVTHREVEGSVSDARVDALDAASGGCRADGPLVRIQRSPR